MTCRETTAGHCAIPVPSSKSLPLRVWSLVLTWHQRYQERLALRQMEPRMLRDMGIPEDKAIAEARKPFWRA